jgi:hypothetical protein
VFLPLRQFLDVDVGLLIKWDLGVEAQIAPGIPVIAKDVTEAIVSGGVSGVALEG